MVIGIVSRSVGAGRASCRTAGRGGPAVRGRPAAERPACDAADPLPRSIRRAAGLEGFAFDPLDLAACTRATAAARAFSAGNGYLPGLIVDRLA